MNHQDAENSLSRRKSLKRQLKSKEVCGANLLLVTWRVNETGDTATTTWRQFISSLPLKSLRISSLQLEKLTQSKTLLRKLSRILDSEIGNSTSHSTKI